LAYNCFNTRFVTKTLQNKQERYSRSSRLSGTRYLS